MKPKKWKLVPYFRIFGYDREIALKTETLISKPPAHRAKRIQMESPDFSGIRRRVRPLALGFFGSRGRMRESHETKGRLSP